MILCSTLRKLAAQGATVYRVDSPAYTARAGDITSSVPAASQHFATMARAKDYADHLDSAARAFGPGCKCSIAAVDAASLDPFTY